MANSSDELNHLGWVFFSWGSCWSTFTVTCLDKYSLLSQMRSDWKGPEQFYIFKPFWHQILIIHLLKELVNSCTKKLPHQPLSQFIYYTWIPPFLPNPQAALRIISFYSHKNPQRSVRLQEIIWPGVNWWASKLNSGLKLGISFTSKPNVVIAIDEYRCNIAPPLTFIRNVGSLSLVILPLTMVKIVHWH